ncbi:MAG TPA: hypothetical protein VH165_37015 [Kofleriaceae bacterium]|nr:hypothetical protein [Kofleriaceae bacterium]
MPGGAQGSQAGAVVAATAPISSAPATRAGDAATEAASDAWTTADVMVEKSSAAWLT